MLVDQRTQEARPPALFTQIGTDPTFEVLLKTGKLPNAKTSTAGVTGSKIQVNRELVEALPEAKRPFTREIRIHTLSNSSIPRSDFPKWSRWYQEDGHTQVFRLFKGETNRRNSRAFAARIEAYSDIKWKESEGKWHEWNGVVTAINPVGMNLQVKNSDNDWSVAIHVSKSGNVMLNRRRGNDETIATNMIGKPFLLTVRDNGRDYEVFLNGKKVGTGTYARPTGTTCFRWGMYVGDNEVTHDAMIFFSGVSIDR